MAGLGWLLRTEVAVVRAQMEELEREYWTLPERVVMIAKVEPAVER